MVLSISEIVISVRVIATIVYFDFNVDTDEQDTYRYVINEK